MTSTKAGQELWDKAERLIASGNMLLSKHKNLYSPKRWPCYYKRCKGAEVIDLDDNIYLDFSSNGVGACSLGYQNPNIDQKVRECISSGVMCSLNTPKEVELAEKLITLHPWAEKAKFARSGGEANAIAIRIARAYTGKEKVAICGYHGWHDWYLSANLKSNSRLNNHLIENLNVSGVPKTLAGTVSSFTYNDFEELERILKDPEIGTIKMEVARSEPPQPGYLEEIRSQCTKMKKVLIFDECTSGFREAYGGLHRKYDIDPDMCMFGKALGNGYAISAVLGKGEIMDAANASFISSTFWTEAIGPHAALATLEEMKEQESWKILPVLGKEIKSHWRKMSETYNLGMIIGGIDALPTFVIPSADWLTLKTVYIEGMLDRGFLASNSFYPSTAITKKEIQLYKERSEEVFNVIGDIKAMKLDVNNCYSGVSCKPTFGRMN